MNFGYDNRMSSNLGGSLSVDYPAGATSGSLSLSQAGIEPNPVSVGMEFNVGGPSKNLLISAGLNMSSNVNAISVVKADDNYRANVHLDSLGKVRGHANVKVDVTSSSKW